MDATVATVVQAVHDGTPHAPLVPSPDPTRGEWIPCRCGRTFISGWLSYRHGRPVRSGSVLYEL
jgi:hypothetical protein